MHRANGMPEVWQDFFRTSKPHLIAVRLISYEKYEYSDWDNVRNGSAEKVIPEYTGCMDYYTAQD